MQPEDALPGDIDANLGAPWIPESDIQAFAADLFHVEPSSIRIGHLKTEAAWSIEADYAAQQSVAATSEYGTSRARGTWLLDLALNMNLDPERRERERLEEALRLNQPLATAYYMKADLRQVWLQPDKATAKRVLDDWIRRAEASGIKVLQQMAATLGAHRSGILNYYDYRISTGPLEGLNNKIKTMKRQAYGFRDREFFKLKIYALHETKYALVG